MVKSTTTENCEPSCKRPAIHSGRIPIQRFCWLPTSDGVLVHSLDWAVGTPLPTPKERANSTGPNVLLFVLDGLSVSNLKRSLPITLTYLTEQLGIFLEVGMPSHYTFQAEY